MNLVKRPKPAPAYAARLARLAKRQAAQASPATERPQVAPRAALPLTFAQKTA